MSETESIEFTRSDVAVHSRNLPNYIGEAWHIQVGDMHYVVSGVNLPAVISSYRSSETMVFPATPVGEVESYGEIVMVPYIDHEEAISELLSVLNDESSDGAA